MTADYVEEISGYDEVDEGSVFSGGAMGSNSKGGSPPHNVRRHGKSGLSSAYGPRGKPGKPIRRSAFSGFNIGSGFDPRQMAGSANGLLFAMVAGVAVAAAMLYYTFFMNTPETFNQFYGALAASMVLVLLIAYLAAKLLHSE